MRSEDRAKKTPQPKATPSKGKNRVNTKARQKRHERNISKAIERRRSQGWIGEQRQAKIDAKAATRRRLATLTKAQRAERAAAGREHRKPRK